jgi:putative cell wall-binding protein
LRTNGEETWSWDGIRWSQLHPVTVPGFRIAPLIAYDASAHNLVLFGGGAAQQGPGSPELRDTWTWNGDNWKQMSPTTSPAAREHACAAYDPTHEQLIMFGGTTPTTSTALADTWSWTGSEWVQLHPATSPSGGGCTMAYDPDIAAVVLITLGPSQADGGALPEVWTWDDADWSPATSGLPDGTPSAAYDADARALIVDDAAFHADGGYNNNIWGGVESEEWQWSGGSWTMLGTTTLDTKITEAGPLVDDLATHQLVLEANGSTYIATSRGASSVTPLRLSGDDRLATAVAASKAAFPDAGSASAVVLARADGFADALAGGPLAAAKGAPLLLTTPGGLSPATKVEIQRVLKPGGTVYLLGGASALAADVATGVSSLGDVPVRLAGTDRVGTALAVAHAMGNPSTVFEANGLSFPDALSAVPAAVATHGVILLTAGGKLSSATSNYLAAHRGIHYAVGGPAAVADPSATALVGADRYATSQAVAAAIFPNAEGVAVASGMSFPDALAGGPVAGKAQQPMLLVPATGTLPEPDAGYLSTRDGRVTSVRVFGGNAAVSSGVVDSIVSTLAGS